MYFGPWRAADHWFGQNWSCYANTRLPSTVQRAGNKQMMAGSAVELPSASRGERLSQLALSRRTDYLVCDLLDAGSSMQAVLGLSEESRLSVEMLLSG